MCLTVYQIYLGCNTKNSVEPGSDTLVSMIRYLAREKPPVQDDIRLIQPAVVEECAKGARNVVQILRLGIEELHVVETLPMDHFERYL